MSMKWDYDATAALLRYGRKYDGPWEDGSIPDDGDTYMIISAPQVAADYAALQARYTALREAVKRYFASAASEQKTCTEDMSDEEYHEWYSERIAAVTGLERLLEDENEIKNA